MTSVVKKNFTNPDNTMRPDKAEVQICNFGDEPCVAHEFNSTWTKDLRPS